MNWKCTVNENEDWDIFWSDVGIGNEKLNKMKNYQKINHFPCKDLT
jgi:hypothetical protein